MLFTGGQGPAVLDHIATRTNTIEAELRRLLDDGAVIDGVPAHYVRDQTEGRGVRGHADAVVRPATTDEVARIVAWCDRHAVPLVPRGGDTGYAAGAVPLEGGVVLSTERLTAVRSFEPLQWRIQVEAGVTTLRLRTLAREHGLLFPPDPGAAEQSHIGGNIATNAGGPHAFKYGVTGAWVTGLEAVVPPGDVVTVGARVRKDVSGYDLKSLLIGSEGTLGIVTAAWLRLVPMPEAAVPIVALYADVAAGCRAIQRVIGSGLGLAALEYLDGETVRLARHAFPGKLPSEAGLMVIAEADGSDEEATRLAREAQDVLGEDAVAIHRPADTAEIGALWRWRDGMALRISAVRGGKASEDIVVPLDRLAEAIDETLEIGRRHGLTACSWGHAGDGNVHSTFLVDPNDAAELDRAALAGYDVLELAVRLGGSISGEHGLGSLKRAAAERYLPPKVLALQHSIKRAFDPRGIMNPGKKV